MRAALLALLLLPALARADAPTWPAAGVCIAPWPSHPASKCIQVSPADAAALRALMVRYLTKPSVARREYRPALAAARRPITDYTIGGYLPYGSDFAGFQGDTLELVTVESSGNGTQTGFRFGVGRATPKAGWQVLWFEHFRKTMPRPDVRSD